MRLAVMVMVLAMAGCASGSSGFAGKQSKNGGPVRVERLGVMTTSESPADQRCESREVRWCNGASCKCIMVKEAEDRVRRLARQMQNQSLNH